MQWLRMLKRDRLNDLILVFFLIICSSFFGFVIDFLGPNVWSDLSHGPVLSLLVFCYRIGFGFMRANVKKTETLFCTLGSLKPI